MSRRRLGPYSVAPIGLGAMPLSCDGRPSEKDAIAVIHAALDAGIDFIDTADVYCLDHRDIGHNERLIRKALAGRSGVLVGTKGGLLRPDGDWTSDASPAHLRAACEASLRALGVERIDLYQLHAPDDDLPIEDSVGEIARMREEGKVAAVGLSNVTADELRRAQKIVPIASVQNRFHPLDPSPIRDGVLHACRDEGVAFIAYSPVGGDGPDRTAIANHPLLRRIASDRGATAYEIALAWILAQGEHVLAIPGASRVASARSSAGVIEFSLSVSETRDLNDCFAR